MSEWYALELIEKSFEDMKQLLLPFDLGKMLKMAVVVLFAGGGAGMSNMSRTVTDMAGQSGTQSASSAGSYMTGMLSSGAFIPGLVILIFGIIALWIITGSIMDFVFVKICSEKTVSISEWFKKNIRNGFRLLGFNLLIGISALILVGIPIGIMAQAGISNVGVAIGAVLILLPVLIIYSITKLLTEDFVIVEMLETDEGIFSSWSSFWEYLSDEWKQVGLFVLMKIALLIGTGIVAGLASVLFLLIAALVFGFLGLVGYGLLSIVESLGMVYIGLLAVVAIVVIFVGMLFIRVPIDTFLRYYSIRVFEKVSDKSIID